jgi:transposase
VSEASIEVFNREAAAKVNMAEIIQTVLNSETMNVDETTMKCTQLKEYDAEKPETAVKTTFNAIIRTHSTAEATVYTVNPHKDDEGIRKDGIIPSFVGILSHDHDKKYYKYGKLHATCGAHLSRELKGLDELYKIEWAGRFRKFYIGLNEYKNATEICEPARLIEFENTYDALLQEGDAILNAMNPKSFGYDVLRPILKRLQKYKDAYLLFIRNYKAPFTNNQAERDLRPCKTKQKVSGCFRSWDGLLCYARIRSFLSTSRKLKRSLLEAVMELFSPSFFIPAEQ